MSRSSDFDAATVLKKAAGRAKSDVANKLVAMVLYQLSQRVKSDYSVRSEEYQRVVRDTFKNRCPYCGTQLTRDNTVIEHLDAMNQYRAGLHIPGNVLPACKRCNLEKRRDDQSEVVDRSVGGWKLFLSHDSIRCPLGCKSCSYWVSVWPRLSTAKRKKKLAEHAKIIKSFRNATIPTGSADLSARIAPLLRDFYEKAQIHANSQTKYLISLITGAEEIDRIMEAPKSDTTNN